MTPLELLEKQLQGFLKNIQKSKEALSKGLISPELHEKHKANNELKIKEFKYAIRVLTTYM
jgi:hypothetical protein